MNLSGSAVRSRILGYVRREYKTLPDYNIVYHKVEKTKMWNPKKTGDRGLDIQVKADDIALKYRDCEMLQKIDNDLVKKYFSVEFQPQKGLISLRKKQAGELVQRHGLDSGSAEAQIANMTVTIQYLQKFIEENTRAVNARVYLKELIDHRRQMLTHLRTWDYRRFEWLLEKLNLEYRPYPDGPKTVTRKNTMRMMTQDVCDDIVNAKLEAYKAELEAQLEDFYARKLKSLEFIMKEEAELGVTPTVTEEEVEAVRKELQGARRAREERTAEQKKSIV